MSSPRRRVRSPALLMVAALACTPACRERSGASADAAADAAAYDGNQRPDSAPAALALDFTATGCPSFDPVSTQCSGTAPLTISFAAVGSASLTRFLWTFGDGTPPSSEPAPTHTYPLPGLYTVSLAGEGPSGSVQRTHEGFVQVSGGGASAPCDLDSQCGDPLACLCAPSADCGAAFARGLCTVACGGDAGPCADGVCADLAAPASTTSPPAWRRPLCLRACATDADCPTGLPCRDLLAPAGAAGAAWLRACFVRFPGDVGASCGDATGALADAACTTGSCADLALGLCSRTCNDGSECPPETACAHFGDGRTLCVRACDTATGCAADPLVACELPGSPGALGFEIQAQAPAGSTGYCAPKRCSRDADCAPAGQCRDAGGGRHCVRL